jgi:hypothetical protein
MSRPANYPAYIPQTPALLDNVAIELRTKLMAHFNWLTNGYLIAERRVKRYEDGRDLRFPAVQVDDKEYINLLPDAHLQNHSYIERGGSDTIDYQRGRSQMQTEAAVVFFFDYRKVYPDEWGSSTIERVKSDVLDFFAQTSFTTAQIKPIRFHDTASSIYQDYDYWEIDSQFLMKPYGALRVDLDIRYFQNCP